MKARDSIDVLSGVFEKLCKIGAGFFPYYRNQVSLKAIGYSKRGVRNVVNQDAWSALPDLGIFIVCDGMGGHVAGDIASNLAIARINQHLRSVSGRIKSEHVRAAIHKANEAVFHLAEQSGACHGMGTTITLAWINSNILKIFYAGDSRAYLKRNCSFTQLTRDHTGLCTQEQDGVKRKGYLLQALGVNAHASFDEIEVQWRKGDELMMVTDGISDVVDFREITNVIVDEEHEREEKVIKLVCIAEKYGGRDDKTILHVVMD